MEDIKKLFDNSIPISRVGNLYVYNRFSDTVICYCANCNKSNIEISISKLKYLSKHNVNVTCGCKIDKQSKSKNSLHIGNSYSSLTIVKKLNNKQYECLCDCGNLIIVDEEKLLNGAVIECLNCNSKNTIQNEELYKQKRRKELYYIWSSYLYLYDNPTNNFKYKVLDKNIKFFPDFNNDFELFYEWAISTGYRKGGKIYMERKDNKEDFTSENCIWNDTDNSKLIDLPKSVLKNSIDEKGDLKQEMSENETIGNLKEINKAKENLYNYIYANYGLTYIPKSIKDVLKQLNNGTSKKYPYTQIDYGKMLDMMRYYQNKLLGLYSEKLKRSQLKTPIERISYDIAVLVSLVGEYDCRLRYIDTSNTHFEQIEDYSKYFQYNVARKDEHDQQKLDEMDKMVREILGYDYDEDDDTEEF